MRRWRDRDETLELDLTPMLDVVFILLIFFIVTATFTEQTSMEINRPTSSTAVKTPQDRENFSISATADGRFLYRGEEISKSSIYLYAKSFLLRTDDKSAILYLDSSIQTGEVVSIMDEIRRAGLTEIAISTVERR